MEVILLEKVRNLGGIGDKVNVKAGFARNYLLPQGKAITANKGNIARFETMRVELEKKSAETVAVAKARAEALTKIEITIPVRAGEGGKLFGSVGTKEVVTAVKAGGEEINKHEVVLPEGPIRQIGEYEINLQLHTDIIIPLKINVVEEK